MASLFRQSNKLSTSVNKVNELNNSSKVFINYLENLNKNLNVNNYTTVINQSNSNTSITNNLTSPFKTIFNPTTHKQTNSKPLEEILKSTIKLIDNNTKKEMVGVSSNEINEQLKNIKSRTVKVLNLYSEIILKK